MKNRLDILSWIIAMFTYAGLALSAFGLDASTATTVTPRPTNEVLLNPGKPSYIGLSQGGKEESLKFLAAERLLIERLANRMGYHFVLKEARYPSTVVRNTSVALQLAWSNEGVAPVYVPCAVALALALLDAKDQPVDLCWPAGQVFQPAGGSVMPSSSGPGSWMPGKSVAEEVKVSYAKAKPGGYRLAVGLVQRTGSEKPWIKLGIEGRTEGGWYPPGQIQVRQ